MRKDPTEFRKRFEAWKKGMPVYKYGKPIYTESNDEIAFEAQLPEVIITGRNRQKPSIMPSVKDTIKTALQYNILKNTGLIDDDYMFYNIINRRRPLFPVYNI